MAINLQCRPSPFLWDTGFVWVPPAPMQGLTDEAGNILTDESGNILTPEAATDNTLTDEKANTLTDEHGNPLAPDL